MCTPVVADQKVQPSKHGQSSRVSFEKVRGMGGLREAFSWMVDSALESESKIPSCFASAVHVGGG